MSEVVTNELRMTQTFSAFFEIYKIYKLSRRSQLKTLGFSREKQHDFISQESAATEGGPRAGAAPRLAASQDAAQTSSRRGSSSPPRKERSDPKSRLAMAASATFFEIVTTLLLYLNAWSLPESKQPDNRHQDDQLSKLRREYLPEYERVGMVLAVGMDLLPNFQNLSTKSDTPGRYTHAWLHAVF